MLYRYSEVFRGLLLISDLSLVAASWLLAYTIRFHTVFASPLGIPQLSTASRSPGLARCETGCVGSHTWPPTSISTRISSSEPWR